MEDWIIDWTVLFTFLFFFAEAVAEEVLEENRKSPSGLEVEEEVVGTSSEEGLRAPPRGNDDEAAGILVEWWISLAEGRSMARSQQTLEGVNEELQKSRL